MKIFSELNEAFWFYIANHLPRLKLSNQYRARFLRFAGIKIGKKTKILSNFDLRPIGFSHNLVIGSNSFININFSCAVPQDDKLIIGNNCIIGPNVSLECVNHSLQWSSEQNWAGKASPIVIGDRVWIGAKSVVLGGVTIEPDSVIAAGAIVNKDVKSKTVVGGVPAKVIKVLP